ncbi:MAG TPA: hypothetical protein VMS56_10455 [Thermoanaerobaculia bacterium]|nr:hypothetical protein [Thermoanaerobaculia bacterium]
MRHPLIAAALIGVAIPAMLAGGEPRAVCSGGLPEYAAALCQYHQGSLERAAERFRAIVEADEPRPETLKARYFLARTLMKLGRAGEASAELIKIHSLSPAFYREWGCDFLLGEARRADGLD